MTVTAFVYRIRLQSMIGAVVLGCVVVTATALSWIVTSEIRRDQAERALDREMRALKLAATLLSSRYPDIKVSWTEDGQVEAITADNFPDVTDGVLIDEISRATEDPATVFRFDKNAQDYFRISTTVKKQDGSRAVGTNLGAQSAAYASIMRGESYYGEAKILGIPYYTVYQPIMGKETPAVGILFTGVKVSTITGAGQTLITKIWIASVILTAMFAAAGFWMARRVFSPVTRLAKAVNQGGSDGEPFEIPYRQSKNEIGALARAIANYRNRAAIARADLQRRNGELLETSRALDFERSQLRIACSELERAKAEADQANRFKSSFLSRMSHEFRAPMHAITSFTKLAQKHIDAARHEKVDTYLQNISLSSSRLMVMLNDLLDLSKLESGIVDFKIEMGDASDVARQSYEELRSLFEEKELDFQIECSAQNNLIWFDENKIAQVFINLYYNAIKFSPNQGVIKVYIREDVIPEESGALHCTVSDQGPGIPQSELESIFGEFVQSGSQRNSHGSSGLGLAICREIVTRHGGKIWAENQIKGGAAFHFLLPRLSNNSAGHSAKFAESKDPLQSVPFPSFAL